MEEHRIQHGARNSLCVFTEETATATLYSPKDEVLLERDVPAGENELLLGPLLCPPDLRYRAGVVEWRGYRLRILDGTGRCQWYSQTNTAVPATWKFREPTRRVPFSRWIPSELDWQRFHLETAFSLPIGLRISEDALFRDWGRTRLVIANESSLDCPPELSFFVLVRDVRGTVLHRSDEIPARTMQEPIQYDFGAARLEEGTYLLSLEFYQDGRAYRDAPEISFLKDSGESACCANPFTQHFLPVREGLAEIHLEVAEINNTLAEARGEDADPLTRIKLWEGQKRGAAKQVKLENPSALFLKCGGCGCGFSLNGSEPQIILAGERYYVGSLPAGDVTLGFHSLFSLKNELSIVEEISFIPLRAMPESRRKSGDLPLTGINDWSQYFRDGSLPRFSQLGQIVTGQQALGFTEISWSIGRSWVEYWSTLPAASRWPVVPLEVAVQRDPRAYNYVEQTAVFEQGCPLREALRQTRDRGMLFTAWMGLNTHYHAEALGGICCSKWFQEHPRFHQWRKGAKKSFPGEVSYYFQEVREERIAILGEVAALGVDRFVLDGTRQPRVVLYHPEMVAEYQGLFGVNPTGLDSEREEAYTHWIQWRSGFFTQFLRDLRQEFSTLHPGRKIHLSLRIPQSGWQLNLASGFDVSTWFREGLIDRLYLNPLEIYGGGLREITPYVEAGHASNVEVYGAIGQTWLWGGGAGVTAALLRASSLIEANVDGIEFFESELLSRSHPLHELVTQLGSRDSIQALLEHSNMAACYPLNNESVMLGYDNHSRWDGKGWRCQGFEENCL